MQHIDVSSVQFHSAQDRATAVVLRRDLRGGLIRERVSAVVHPTWGLGKMAHALHRAAQSKLDNRWSRA